jgi:hypothetical protein
VIGDVADDVARDGAVGPGIAGPPAARRGAGDVDRRGVGSDGGDGVGGGGGGATEAAHLHPAVRYAKEEVFEICGALAMAEVVLACLDRPVEAARMAVVFDLVEGRLVG